MHQQKAVLQIHQQVFAPTAYANNLLAHQKLRITPQGPAQGLAQDHRLDACAGYARRKTQAGDFDFG